MISQVLSWAKKVTFALMNRLGYEELRDNVEKQTKSKKQVII